MDGSVRADTREPIHRRVHQDFRELCTDRVRTGPRLNVDGTIYLYASGAMQNAPNNNRTVWSTTDYLTWTPHQMNLGLVAPTVVQIGDKFYMAGNNTPVYQADSPTGPWTSMGSFLRPSGQNLSVGDVQFFPDTDGRLYLTYNIGSPIMGVELDPNNPRQLISDPVVLWTFDPRQEWQHIGDNKATYTHGYVEGSQLFKVRDTYYLSVASGGTEFTTYATGVMTSNKPLSGFKSRSRTRSATGTTTRARYIRTPGTAVSYSTSPATWCSSTPTSSRTRSSSSGDWGWTSAA